MKGQVTISMTQSTAELIGYVLRRVRNVMEWSDYEQYVVGHTFFITMRDDEFVMLEDVLESINEQIL
jgi:hypothetical protein